MYIFFFSDHLQRHTSIKTISKPADNLSAKSKTGISKYKQKNSGQILTGKEVLKIYAVSFLYDWC